MFVNDSFMRHMQIFHFSLVFEWHFVYVMIFCKSLWHMPQRSECNKIVSDIVPFFFLIQIVFVYIDIDMQRK